ncbi:hypothetical protein TNCV_2035561 [Trichonephila clavipes]|nr:hypothetical protein TNCV_2035561 [Trichonephila clavipes]
MVPNVVGDTDSDTTGNRSCGGSHTSGIKSNGLLSPLKDGLTESVVFQLERVILDYGSNRACEDSRTLETVV